MISVVSKLNEQNKLLDSIYSNFEVTEKRDQFISFSTQVNAPLSLDGKLNLINLLDHSNGKLIDRNATTYTAFLEVFKSLGASEEELVAGMDTLQKAHDFCFLQCIEGVFSKSEEKQKIAAVFRFDRLKRNTRVQDINLKVLSVYLKTDYTSLSQQMTLLNLSKNNVNVRSLLSALDPTGSKNLMSLADTLTNGSYSTLKMIQSDRKELLGNVIVFSARGKAPFVVEHNLIAFGAN